MRRIYFAATIEKDDRYASLTLSAGYGDNLVSLFERTEGLKYAQVCESRKRADEIVECWNRCHKANGAYLYTDDTL